MKKFIVLLIIGLLMPFFADAQAGAPEDVIFKAKVTEIIREQENSLSGNIRSLQQHLKLVGLEGEFNEKEIEFNGIGEIDVLNKQVYKTGDKVLVAASYDFEGRVNYYIVDYVRTSSLWWLAAIFLSVLILVGRFKGIRSLIALILSFLIIIYYIIPKILNGASPLMVTLTGSLAMLIIIIYITEGIKPRSHLSAISIFICLTVTVILSSVFVGLTKLTGAAGEEVLFLFNIEGATINLQGLLLAGIIIGALGVLDDVVISQVATTEQIAQAGNNIRFRELYKKSYNVGVSHIASMTNTLFLAYAGVSLPLLILFVTGESAFDDIWQAVNTEMISAEIVRTFAGSIGLILSVPIATLISSWWFSRSVNINKKKFDF